MKNLLLILTLGLLITACQKSKIEQNKPDLPAPKLSLNPHFAAMDTHALSFGKGACVIINQNQNRPGAALEAYATGPHTIFVKWKKKGNQNTTTVYLNGAAVWTGPGTTHTIEGLQANTTYRISVNGISVSVTTEAETGGALYPHVILLKFEGYMVSGTSWNYNGAMYWPPSGIPVDKQDSIIRMVQWTFSYWPNVKVTTSDAEFNAADPSRRAIVVFTPYSSWFGTGAGGAAFIGVWGTSNAVAVAFTDIIPPDLFDDLAFVASHEAGHMLGNHHVVDYAGQGVSFSNPNLEAACWSCPFYSRKWEDVVMLNTGDMYRQIDAMSNVFRR